MCFGSRRKDEADAMRSRELDKIIKADEKRMAKEVKLLLLGTYLCPCQTVTYDGTSYCPDWPR